MNRRKFLKYAVAAPIAVIAAVKAKPKPKTMFRAHCNWVDLRRASNDAVWEKEMELGFKVPHLLGGWKPLPRGSGKTITFKIPGKVKV